MKAENFQRAKEIEIQIRKLNDWIDPLLPTNGRLPVIILHTDVKSNDFTFRKNDCPDLFLHLKETFIEEMDVLSERMKRAVDKEIKKLEKEFESL